MIQVLLILTIWVTFGNSSPIVPKIASSKLPPGGMNHPTHIPRRQSTPIPTSASHVTTNSGNENSGNEGEMNKMVLFIILRIASGSFYIQHSIGTSSTQQLDFIVAHAH